MSVLLEDLLADLSSPLDETDKAAADMENLGVLEKGLFL
jgi:hypothetical protein